MLKNGLVKPFFQFMSTNMQSTYSFFCIHKILKSRVVDSPASNIIHFIMNFWLKSNVILSLRELFSEYWNMFYDYYNHKGLIRPAVKENAEAMIHCKDFSKGYLF